MTFVLLCVWLNECNSTLEKNIKIGSMDLSCPNSLVSTKSIIPRFFLKIQTFFTEILLLLQMGIIIMKEYSKYLEI